MTIAYHDLYLIGVGFAIGFVIALVVAGERSE
jgi:hypothetical protein